MGDQPVRMDITFRPISRADFGLLSKWLSSAHVQAWWREDGSPGAVSERYGPCVEGTDPTEVFIVEGGGAPLGLIQRYLTADNPDWAATLSVTGVASAAAGMDYLIGERSVIGAGVGTAMIDRFVESTWERYPAINSIAVAVAAANPASWRVLEKVGFRREWTGELASEDPSDEGISHVYVLGRPPSGARLAGVDDAEAIGGLLDAFNREFNEPTPGADRLAERVRQLMSQSDFAVLVAGEPPSAIAVLHYRPNLWSDRLECWLAELYLAPERRGAGMGRALVGEAICQARAHGADRIEVATGEHNSAARRIYEQVGFTDHDRHGEATRFYGLDL